MFTGIVNGLFNVLEVQKLPGMIKYSIEFPESLLNGLKIGASVSVDGVCQTVVQIQGSSVWFDAIQETLEKTSLNDLHPGQKVNIERAARFGDEIGGHVLSGHVYGKAQISKITSWENNRKVTLNCHPQWIKYLFSKGYIAIDGASLTLVDVDSAGYFSVHLIPETIRMTTLGIKREGDWVNLEFDSQVQTIVETVERVLGNQGLSNSWKKSP
jgi:riboflavin synthase